MPLEGRKGSSVPPLNKIEAEADDTQPICLETFITPKDVEMLFQPQLLYAQYLYIKLNFSKSFCPVVKQKNKKF